VRFGGRETLFLRACRNAQQADGDDEEQTRFDEKFAAIEPILQGHFFKPGSVNRLCQKRRGGGEIKWRK